MLTRNQIIRGKCIDVSNEGKGIVRYKKDIIFIDGLFLDEEADIEITYQRAGVYFGVIKKLYSFSKYRIQPKCKICSSCGGCQYQQISYDYQLILKTKRVKDAIKHIGGFDVSVNDCIGMENPYNYRNKIQVPFAKDKKGNIKYGFYKENTHEIISTKQCYIEDERAASILWDIKCLLEEMKISPYNEDLRSGILRYVLIRTSYHFKELMVVLVVSKLNFPGQRNFVDALLKKHPEITTIVENVNTRKTNVILGDINKTLFGKGFIKDSISDLVFEISPSSFFQVNPIQVEKLYKTAINCIDNIENKIVLDAYAGVGTIGLIVAKKAKSVISVEIVKSSHFDAINNAKRNDVKNIRFILDDASRYIANTLDEFDVVIMDPPRKGSDEKFLSTLINRKVKEIVYISCCPETLARDLKYLSKYYDVNYVQPVDMFPMSSHVETVLLLQLKTQK